MKIHPCLKFICGRLLVNHRLTVAASTHMASGVAGTVNSKSEYPQLAAEPRAPKLVDAVGRCQAERDSTWLRRHAGADVRGHVPVVGARRDSGVYFQPFLKPCGSTRESPYRLVGRVPNEHSLPRNACCERPGSRPQAVSSDFTVFMTNRDSSRPRFGNAMSSSVMNRS